MAEITIKKAPKQIDLSPEAWGIELQFLSVGKIKVDKQDYQRKFVERKSDKIAAEFDTNKFDPIRVAIREDGDMYVVDGQHRLIALRKLGIKWVPAIVEKSASIAAEAEQFVGLNTRRTRPDAMSIFKANLTAGDPDTVIAQGILDATDWRLNEGGLNTRRAKPGLISSPETLLKSIKRYDEWVVTQALTAMRTAWPDDPYAGSANLLAGMAKLMFKFGDVIVMKRLQDKLDGVTPATVINNAKQLATVLPGHGGMKIDEAVAQVLFQIYQKQRRGRKIDWNSRSVTFKDGVAIRKDFTKVAKDKPTVLEETEPEPEVNEPEPTNNSTNEGDAVDKMIADAVSSTK